ncbi:alpha/beta hydrolase family protein [Ferruginibacter sp.]
MKKFNDAKNYVLDETGNQLAFVAERDSVTKALTKFYKLWYFRPGQDSAVIVAHKNSIGMKLGTSVSENANLLFSKDGKKLFFGTASIKAPKDTTLVDFELARLDVWHYNDDYLQPQQLKQLDIELRRSYMAVVKPGENKIVQLGAEDAERITLVDEGNADWVLSESNKGNRVEGQWTGRTKSTAYVINTNDGTRKLVLANAPVSYDASPAGKFVYWYDAVKKNYFTYDVVTGVTKNVTEKIKVPLYDEENDVPDVPGPHGVMGWSAGDKNLYVYDKYEVWNVSPGGTVAPAPLIEAAQLARKNQVTYRYISTNREERFINTDSPMIFRVFDNTLKTTSLERAYTKNGNLYFNNALEKYGVGFPVKAKNAAAYIYTKENYTSSPNLYYENGNGVAKVLSDINPQQKEYNWGTAELFKWKTYNGKESEGIIYKPENFDPKKKYPMISYFYEKLSDGLYTYQPPSPTPSRLNIPFFVSRGYVVFAPDISYTTGHPGNDAYNYIVSGVRAIVKLGYVDSTKLGLQGQSWGGYQTAFLITKTKLFAAAWAGAPVVNMTSAYGGIRWGSGLNRQFQYEKTQSRIGGTLWEKQNLYLENSPLFHLPNVTTPLVIMSNDADDAVPWYQGIEFFTAMRRLNKPVWLLVYNNEAHNLIERKNRKDIQIREQQFFDWKLKGDKPAKWLTEGVPATQKGIDWGLKVE